MNEQLVPIYLFKYLAKRINHFSNKRIWEHEITLFDGDKLSKN